MNDRFFIRFLSFLLVQYIQTPFGKPSSQLGTSPLNPQNFSFSGKLLNFLNANQRTQQLPLICIFNQRLALFKNLKILNYKRKIFRILRHIVAKIIFKNLNFNKHLLMKWSESHTHMYIIYISISPIFSISAENPLSCCRFNLYQCCGAGAEIN